MIAVVQYQMETMAKEKGDMFDTMVVDEAKIRLGEEGWKQRYYQVTYFLLLPLHSWQQALCISVGKPQKAVA